MITKRFSGSDPKNRDRVRALISDTETACDKLVLTDRLGDDLRKQIVAISNQARTTFRILTIGEFAEILEIGASSIPTVRNIGRMPRQRLFEFLNTLAAFLRPLLPSEEIDLNQSIAELGWTAPKAEATASIEELRTSLARVLRLVQQANVKGGDESVLSSLEREEIIALLQTALLHLQAPLVERSFLKKLGQSLEKIGQRAVERQVELGLGAAATAAAAAVGSFVIHWLK